MNHPIKMLGAALCLALPWLAAPVAQAADQALLQHGAYLAKAGDCMACHSALRGKPFAGGLPMATPLGKIYSTNITPDPETGIGRYTEADFVRALREGVAERYWRSGDPGGAGAVSDAAVRPGA
jgi:mono/diheme cytochrome c family protein